MQFKEELLRPNLNNFTVVRFVLASSVIYSHSYEILSGNYAIDGLSRFIGSPVSNYAVDGFFVLSGFLVYPSLQRLKNPLRFLAARLTRLWPALAFSVVSAVIGGLLFTSASGFDYARGETAKFVLGNLTFMKGFYQLTGVSCGNAPCIINGSLWTLPWEFRCYLLLAFLGLTTLARPSYMARLILPLTVLGVVAWDFDSVRAVTSATFGAGIVYYINTFDRLWPLFALGTAAYIFRKNIPLSWVALGILFIVDLVSQKSPFALQARAIFVGYAVLCFGLLTAKRKALSGNWPDYSYGMYIYAFPIMMAIKGLGMPLSYSGLAVATGLATLPVAAFSWHFIEKPALDWFRRRSGRQPALAHPS